MRELGGIILIPIVAKIIIEAPSLPALPWMYAFRIERACSEKIVIYSFNRPAKAP